LADDAINWARSIVASNSAGEGGALQTGLAGVLEDCADLRTETATTRSTAGRGELSRALAVRSELSSIIVDPAADNAVYRASLDVALDFLVEGRKSLAAIQWELDDWAEEVASTAAASLGASTLVRVAVEKVSRVVE